MTKEIKEKVTFRVSKKIRDYIRKQKSDTQSENQWFVKLMEQQINPLKSYTCSKHQVAGFGECSECKVSSVVEIKQIKTYDNRTYKSIRNRQGTLPCVASKYSNGF